MSKEIEALKAIWYGHKTQENFNTVCKALEALDIVRQMNIIHTDEAGSAYIITIPSSVLYVSEERCSLLEEVFIKWR